MQNCFVNHVQKLYKMSKILFVKTIFYGIIEAKVI